IRLQCEWDHDFVNCLEKWIHKDKPDMVVMGITGRSKLGQTFIGSNTLAMIRKNLCPVLVVPPGARFNDLKKIALASDFMQAPSLRTSEIAKKMLSAFFARLYIVNVNPDHNVSIAESHQNVQDE